MGAPLEAEVPVFAETNLGTRIAIAVPPDITAGDFRRKLERSHTECFPELGIPDFKTVMVKQKSKFYCLPDLLPLKSACCGCKKLWFVHLSNELGKFQASKSRPAERRVINRHINDCIIVKKNFANIKPKKRKLRGLWPRKVVRHGLLAVAYALRKKKKTKRCIHSKFSAGSDSERLEQECLSPYGKVSCVPKAIRADSKEAFHPVQVQDCNATVESPCESLSGAVSVTGIIDRYFSNLIELNHIGSPSISEVASRAGQNQLDEQDGAENTTSGVLGSKKRRSVIKASQKLLPSTSPKDSDSVGLRRKYERSEVGERLVTASNALRLYQSKQRSQKSNLSKGKKFWEPDACSVAKRLVFEIGDDD